MKNIVKSIVSAAEDISAGILAIIVCAILVFGPWIAIFAIGVLL